MIYKRTAYDLDGVIFPLLKRHKPFYRYSGAERKEYEAKRLWFYRNAPLILKPKEEEFYIVSARQYKYRFLTYEWLERNSIKYKDIHLMDASLTFKNIVEHKSKYIKELGITRYYEDDPKIIKYLDKLFPHIELIEVTRDEISVKTDLDIEVPTI